MKNTQPLLSRIVFLISTWCLIFAMLSGCMYSRSAISKYRSDFNFSQISSYSFYDRNSDFSNFQNISDATRNSIELAIEQVLDKNGFEYQLPESADVVVAYHLINRKSKELATYNKGVKYCAYCLRAGEGKKGKDAWKIIPGSLIVDIINPESQSSVWRSVYDLKIKVDKDNSKEVQLKIYQAINAMMEKYPHQQNISRNKLVVNHNG